MKSLKKWFYNLQANDRRSGPTDDQHKALIREVELLRERVHLLEYHEALRNADILSHNDRIDRVEVRFFNLNSELVHLNVKVQELDRAFNQKNKINVDAEVNL